MLIQHESPAGAPAAVSGMSKKTLQLLRKRFRQLLRVTIVVAAGLALGATAVAIWWLTSLNALPDIGDPFDVAAFLALRVPDDQNAFAFLRRADKRLTPWPELPRAMGLSALTVPWSKADPKLRTWVEANRHALEIFRQGAEQTDAAIPAGDPSNDVRPLSLILLALLEGSKRQESGDSAGAWECYRAVLRMTAHVGGRGSLDQRFCVNFLLSRGWLQQRLATWAADPRTTIPQLTSVLDEVNKIEPKPDGDSFALKSIYIDIMRFLQRPMDPRSQQEIEGEWTVRLGDLQLSAEIIESIEASHRFLLREPERSRRVVRLLWANWLAHAESLEPRPRNPAVRAQLTALNPISVALYPVSPDAPAGARALPPQAVASWLVTTRDAKLRILGMNNWMNSRWPPDRVAYRRTHRELIIMLAREIYHRDRGSLPPSEQALVGTYLKSLPDDVSADGADERTPTVE
jgi:hypothetical protein